MVKKARNTQAKPLRAAVEPEAHVHDRAGLSADSGAGDPQTISTDTPRGSSGTAREASSTDGGTTAATPDVGTQSGSPNLSADASQAAEGGGAGADAAGSASADMGALEAAIGEANAKWPYFFAASEAWKAASPGALPSVIRIASKVDGFRRAGIAHPKGAVEHPIYAFDPDQIEQLLGEPNLTVEFA